MISDNILVAYSVGVIMSGLIIIYIYFNTKKRKK